MAVVEPLCRPSRVLALLAVAGLQAAWAQVAPPLSLDAQRAQREQIQQWQRQARRPADLARAPGAADWLPPLPGELPCVVLTAVQIRVLADPVPARQHPVPHALQALPADYLQTCVGQVGLQRLQSNLSARLHALGYITSTLQLPEQNLADGVLHVELQWGRLGQVNIQADAGAGMIASAPAGNALALQAGAPLNLRDIEHTLENLARLPSQQARFIIEPGSQPLHSDLRIVVAAQAPWRASLGFDAAGLPTAPTRDVQAQLWLDAPWGWSDQLMVSASATPEAAGEQRAQRRSLYAQWSLPWGRHLLSVSASVARNQRSLAGGVGRFRERGAEDQASLRWQTTAWRGASWRSQVWAGWTERRSRSHIDDVELLSRRRVASELGLGIGHWQRLHCGEASVALEATHTRRLARVADFQDLTAPLPRLWRAQLDWHCDWPAGAQDSAQDSALVSAPDSAPDTFSATLPDTLPDTLPTTLPASVTQPAGPGWAWLASAWTEAVQRPFDGTDLLTVGSRHTVRGHSAAQALQGQRISVARLGITAPGQRSAFGLAWQPWLAWDVGRSDRPAPGAARSEGASRSRQAAVLGMRWQAGIVGGEWSWARAIGASPVPRHGQWQAQAHWWF